MKSSLVLKRLSLTLLLLSLCYGTHTSPNRHNNTTANPKVIAKGIMVSDLVEKAMKQKRITNMRIKTPRLLTSFALMLALSIQILPFATVSASPSAPGVLKVSSDLKTDGEDRVQVILQLSDK